MTKKQLISLVTICFAIVYITHAQTKLSNKDIESIKQVEKNFEIAWLKNDEKAVLSSFWEDATLYPNGNKPINGIAEIKKFWFTPSDTVDTLSKYDIKIEELYGEKNMAVGIATNDIAWTSETKGKPEVRRFTALRSMMVIYLKRNNQWKIFKRHWSGKLQEVK
jgi:ketosteroid isomerase-like protein